jgi:hypothetical protein
MVYTGNQGVTALSWRSAMAKKARSKVITNPKTGRKKTVRYGQAGNAKDGGPRVKPGTAKGDAYCARSLAQKKKHKKAGADPNSPLNLSRKRWKCSGAKSRRSK